MDERFLSIMDRSLSRAPICMEDCGYLMSFPEDSQECQHLISTVDSYVRERCGNTAEIGVQIGVMMGPCMADCGFCNYAYSTTDVEAYDMKADELTRYLDGIVREGIVTTVSLMTIHNFDFDHFLDLVETARSVLPDDITLAINTGDLESSEARELKAAGVRSAYHAVRLGESIDNMLEPLGRYETIRNLVDAGIEVCAGVDPIGPEHSVHEICELYYRAMRYGCHCCSASAREPVPGTRLFKAGAITPRRLKQIRSALIISSTDRDDTELGFYGGFYGGFDRMYAEYAGSPKDTMELSEKGLMRTVQWARDRLRDDGYERLRTPDGSTIPL